MQSFENPFYISKHSLLVLGEVSRFCLTNEPKNLKMSPSLHASANTCIIRCIMFVGGEQNFLMRFPAITCHDEYI